MISSVGVWDVVYGACRAAKLAYNNGCGSEVQWVPEGWNSTIYGDPHTLINADSWAFFASGVYFQKANKLFAHGRADNDCGIYSPYNTTNSSMDPLEYEPQDFLPSVNRSDGTYNATAPPSPAPENTPPEDPPTPILPYNATELPANLALPFNASAYFETYTLTSLPNTSKHSPTTITTATTTPVEAACSGNQIEGSCTMSVLASATPNSGPESPICNKVDSSNEPFLMFNQTQAANGAANYCAELITNNIVLSASTPIPASGKVENAAENDGYIAFTVLFDVNCCDPGTSSADQKLDLKALGQDQCYQNLYEILAEQCKLLSQLFYFGHC